MNRKTAVVVLFALLSWSSLAGIASAKPLEHVQFEEISSTVLMDFCASPGRPGLTVREDINVRGTTRVSARGPYGLVYFHETAKGSISWTNVENNLTMTSTFSFNNKDLKVTDNGDGTITVVAFTAGSGKVHLPDGSFFRDTGHFRFEIVIDDNGTPADPSDDVELSFTVVKSTGNDDTADRNFCDDIHEFIG